jgi:dihydropyrimidine dehydrogenase (NAD+) subunit PreT
MTSRFQLPDDRVEKALPDKKPLFGLAEARAESERCLYCADAPCIKACPTEIDVPTFIKKIASGNIRGSARTIFEQNVLGYSCARVCPTEVLCEGACVYTAWQKAPIKIGRLQRYATQHATAQGEPAMFTAKSAPSAGRRRKIALVGAGPASLSCAAYLTLEGHEATIFERLPVPGGLNTTGIAPYKLHAEDALHEIEWVQGLGVEIKTGVEIGRDVSAKDLLDAYDAVFIGVGLGKDTKLGLAGEDGPCVHGAVQWIERMKTLKKSDAKLHLGRVIVVGGGNTAIDVARESALLGAEHVTMVYRRGADEMSGYLHEMDGARKEGVTFAGNTLPHSFVRDANGKLVALKVVAARHGKPLHGTEHDLPCDAVVVAIGQAKLRDLAKQFPGVEMDDRGWIKADPRTGATGNPKVWSGGDCINGGKEVVNAVADGRNAARTLVAAWAREASE